MGLSVGTRLGPYEVLTPLGAGGMGEVWKARDTRVGREVALKVLPEDFLESEERKSRFEREARTLASLNHPNIATLYSFEEIPGTSFPPSLARHILTMELLEGWTLREASRDRRLGVRDVVDYGLQIAEGLAAAHARGIVHRDLKPENLFLTSDGRVKILDFGLARAVGPASRVRTESVTEALTEEGHVFGTVPYMAPEQLRGERADARSDLFSLGTILYEMAGGRRPFAGASGAEVAAAILKEDPPPLETPHASLPHLFTDLVRQCLEKDPARRPQSAMEVRDRLRDLDGELRASHRSQAAPSPDGGRPVSWALVAIGSVLAVSALLLLPRLFRPRPTPAMAPNPERLTQVTDSLGLDAFPSFSPDGAQIAYCSDRDGSFEIYVRQLAPEGREIRITSNGPDNVEPSWSPDGSRIAYASRRFSGVWVTPALGGEPRRLTTFGARPAWSPDGVTIVFQSDPVVDLSPEAPGAGTRSSLWVVAAAGGEPMPLTHPGEPPGHHGSPVFSPDGNEVVFMAWPRIWSVSRKDASVRRILPRKEDEGAGTPRRLYFDPAFSPKGDFLYFADTDLTFRSASVWRSRAPTTSGGSWGPPERVTPDGTAWVRHIAVSRTGRIAYAAISTTSNLWALSLDPKTSLPGGAASLLTRVAGGRASQPRFSPDGQTIAFILRRANTVQDVWVASAGGGDARPVTLGHGVTNYPAWLPDGHRIAFTTTRDGKRGIWAVTLEGRTESLLLPLANGTSWPALSPDGKQFAYWTAAPDRELATWVAPLDGGPARRVTSSDVSAAYARWSPDGRTLAVEVHRPPDWVLATVPATGGPLSLLVEEKGLSWPYDFSPDGERISFAGQRDGIWNIYWVARKDRTVRRLTDNSQGRTFLRYPAWSPTGDRIVYERSETTGNIWLLEPAR